MCYSSTLTDLLIETYYDADGVERILKTTKGKTVVDYLEEDGEEFEEFKLSYLSEEY